MAAGETFVGRRVRYRPGWPGPRARPGSYCKVPLRAWWNPRHAPWRLVDPRGGAGEILPARHQVTEHDDGTITVTPSLVMPSGWHGYLERGVWREV